MLPHLLKLLLSQQNQFLSGGMVLMLLGGLAASLRSYPHKLFSWLKRQVIIEAEILNHDPAFAWITLWLNEQPYSRKSRRLTVNTLTVHEESDIPKVVFTPAPGNHFFIYKGRLLWLHRDRTEKDGKEGEFSMLRPKETITFRMIGRSQEVIRSLIEDARITAETEKKNTFSIYMSIWSSWSKVPTVLNRKLESVILPEGVTEGVLADIREFAASKDWYAERGIPYHRGYMFYGTPGTGKSSLVTALASEMKMDLYVLNMAARGMSDSGLVDLLANVKPNGILLLEDIDSVAPKRRDTKDDDDGKKDDGVTMSGLLNCLDGVLARDGSVVFMTTNYIEKLDPALIRPGRVDYMVEFKAATEGQARRIFRRFFGTADEEQTDKFAAAFTGKTMCEIQQHLIKHRASPEAAVNALTV